MVWPYANYAYSVRAAAEANYCWWLLLVAGSAAAVFFVLAVAVESFASKPPNFTKPIALLTAAFLKGNVPQSLLLH